MDDAAVAKMTGLSGNCGNSVGLRVYGPRRPRRNSTDTKMKIGFTALYRLRYLKEFPGCLSGLIQTRNRFGRNTRQLVKAAKPPPRPHDECRLQEEWTQGSPKEKIARCGRAGTRRAATRLVGRI